MTGGAVQAAAHPLVSRRAPGKTVLLIDYFFPPLGGAGVHRTLGYARHLPEFGWTPVVLTVRAGEHSFHDESLLQRVPSGISVRRSRSLEPVRLIKGLMPRRARGGAGGSAETNGPSDGRANAGSNGWLANVLGRLRELEAWVLFPDRRLGWLPFGVAEAIAIGRHQRVDVIYSTSTAVTSHFIACALKSLWGVPWVADFQDPWARNYVSRFPSRMHQRIADHLESLIVRKADRVTVTTEPLRTVLQEQHRSVASNKFVVIPMGFDPEVFAGISRLRRDKFTITHLGNFYGPRSPGPFLTALGRWIGEDPESARHVEVLFFGGFDPPLRALTEKIVARAGLGEIVRLRGTVPYQTGLQQIVNSDVLLLVTDPGGCGQHLIPSKLYEYLAAGRVILALAPEGAAANVVRATGAGPVVPPDDIAGIGRAIAGLYRRWREGQLDAAVRPEALQQFTWPALTGRFAAALQEALGPSHAEPAPARG